MKEDVNTCLGCIIALVNALGDDIHNDKVNKDILDAFYNMKNNIDVKENIEILRQDKDILVPDCKVCKHPCGRTAEVNINLFPMETQKKALALIKCYDTYSIIDLFGNIVMLPY